MKISKIVPGMVFSCEDNRRPYEKVYIKGHPMEHLYVVLNCNEGAYPFLGYYQCMVITSMKNKDISTEIPIKFNNKISYIVPYSIHSLPEEAFLDRKFKGFLNPGVMATDEFLQFLLGIYHCFSTYKLGHINKTYYEKTMEKINNYKTEFSEIYDIKEYRNTVDHGCEVQRFTDSEEYDNKSNESDLDINEETDEFNEASDENHNEFKEVDTMVNDGKSDNEKNDNNHSSCTVLNVIGENNFYSNADNLPYHYNKWTTKDLLEMMVYLRFNDNSVIKRNIKKYDTDLKITKGMTNIKAQLLKRHELLEINSSAHHGDTKLFIEIPSGNIKRQIDGKLYSYDGSELDNSTRATQQILREF